MLRVPEYELVQLSHVSLTLGCVYAEVKSPAELFATIWTSGTPLGLPPCSDSVSITLCRLQSSPQMYVQSMSPTYLYLVFPGLVGKLSMMVVGVVLRSHERNSHHPV